MSVPLREVPTRWRRAALRHLASVEAAPDVGKAAVDADLGPTAWPLYRPDVDGVAYWQFELVSAADRGGGAGAPFGFIVVSTGEHDYPIPHWSLERPPVSSILATDATKRGKKVARIYRLDALAYLAEDEAGEEVARSGQAPGILERAGREQASETSSATVRPPKPGDDANPPKTPFAVERKGPEGAGVNVTDPTGWGRLKERYAAAFAPQLDDVRRNAGRAWQIDRDIEEFGEGVMAGEPFAVRLLDKAAKVDVDGDAKSEVSVQTDEKRRGRPILRGGTKRGSHDKERAFEIRVQYESGEEERLRYFVVSPDTRSDRRGKGESGKPA